MSAWYVCTAKVTYLNLIVLSLFKAEGFEQASTEGEKPNILYFSILKLVVLKKNLAIAFTAVTLL